MHLNNDELILIKDSEVLRLKTNALQKIEYGLQQLQASITQILKDNEYSSLIADVGFGKISRGENYLGLPYRVLDHPAIFKKTGIFTCRTMFLWGKYFSFTLHLSGDCLESQRMNLFNQLERLKKTNCYFCINTNPWEYYLESPNFTAFEKIAMQELEQFVLNRNFIKISYKLALEDYSQLIAAGISFYQEQFDWLRKEWE